MVLARLQASLDILHGVVAGVDSTQQQMRVQQELQAAAIADGAIKHADTALILRAIMDKLQIGDGGGSERRSPEEEPDPGSQGARGHSTLEKTTSHWVGNTAGASSSDGHKSGMETEAVGTGFLGGAGGGRPGGAGCSGTGGVGDGGLGGVGGLGHGGAGSGRT